MIRVVALLVALVCALPAISRTENEETQGRTLSCTHWLLAIGFSKRMMSDGSPLIYLLTPEIVGRHRSKY